MAYAAVLSLVDTIKETLPSAYSSSETLPSALHHAKSLKRTLKECSEEVVDMDEQMIIIEAAIKLEDAIEFPLLSQPPTFSSNLDDDIHCFVQTAKERIQIIEGLWEQKAAKEIEEAIEELFVQKPDQEEEEEEEEEEMVGLCDQFLQIRDMVLEAYNDKKEATYFECDERVIWINGMAGVGKTALAKRVFHDPLIKAFFQSRAFIRVGSKFGSNERKLLAIIDELNLDSQKSLLLLDDVWSSTLIGSLIHEKRKKREDGIFFLVTGRISPTSYALIHIKMRFMDEEESWELLRRKVFGEEQDCPPQLVKPGKKIAEKCEGLPLLINAVAPILLSKAHKDPECWNRVAQKPDSVLEEASHQISQVLLKSYNQIQEDEKLCFLYITSFPLSCVVPHSTIINLWLLEGFTKHSRSYKELVRVNLVIDCQKSWSEAEALRLHCSYWYVSRRVAENNKFLYIIKSCADDLDEGIKNHRRLAIQENILLAIKEVHNKIASITNVRSLLCNGPYNQYQVPICWEWKLLRVLRVLTIRFYEFPVEVVKLIRLKYLALTCNANLPPFISELSNLQFLIVHQHLNVKRVAAPLYLPVEIWYLEKLIHLEITGRNLPDPPPGVDLHNLIGLLGVGVESCTREVLESLPVLNNLRIQIELAPDATQTSSCFDLIPSFFNIQSFEIAIVNSTLSSPPSPLYYLGHNIWKLSLSGFGYPWEDMSKISHMWSLRELKLQCYAFRGEKWEAKVTEFRKLRFLLIEDTDLVQWTAENETLVGLWNLTMKNCHKLQQIPFVQNTHIEVELVDCSPLVETCAKRYDKCSVKYSWKEKVNS